MVSCKSGFRRVRTKILICAVMFIFPMKMIFLLCGEVLQNETKNLNVTDMSFHPLSVNYEHSVCFCLLNVCAYRNGLFDVLGCSEIL